jgi:hypothetical protein
MWQRKGQFDGIRSLTAGFSMRRMSQPWTIALRQRIGGNKAAASMRIRRALSFSRRVGDERLCAPLL